jgi:hypothetical protein
MPSQQPSSKPSSEPSSRGASSINDVHRRLYGHAEQAKQYVMAFPKTKSVFNYMSAKCVQSLSNSKLTEMRVIINDPYRRFHVGVVISNEKVLIIRNDRHSLI